MSSTLNQPTLRGRLRFARSSGIALLAVLAVSGCTALRKDYPVRDASTPPPQSGEKSARVFSDDRVAVAPDESADAVAMNSPEPERSNYGLDYRSLPAYPLGPGDVIEVIYQLRNLSRDEPYRLEILDEVDISFLYTPRYDRRLTVRTDGKLELPLVGDFQVVGKTTAEIEEELLKAFADYLKDAQVQVRVVKSNTAIEELKRAITTSPRGQSRLEPVRPDGFISLPLVGDVGASGLTVPQLQDGIVAKYREAGVLDIDVTVVLLEVKSPIVYALGAVARPGPIVLQGPSDVWRVIGEAGGFNDTADRRHVVVAQSRPDGEARHVLNFDAWTLGKAEQNMAIQRGDIVYVNRLLNPYVFVAGEVDKPGPVVLEQGQQLTAGMAVAAAGGIRDRADEGEILILRKTSDGQPLVVVVRLDEVYDLSNYEGSDPPPIDPLLRPGDVVYVPRSKVGDLNRFAGTWFKDGIWTLIPFNATANYDLND